MESRLDDLLVDDIVRALNPDQLEERILRQAIALVDSADGASLSFRTADGSLQVKAAHGRLVPFVGRQLPLDGSLAGLAVTSGIVQVCHDATVDPRVDVDLCTELGLVSLICLPLSSDPESTAVLEVCSGDANAFGDADVEALADLADFLRATTAAAASVAQAAVKVLSRSRRSGAGSDGADHRRTRFVANVLEPDLVNTVESRERIRDVIERGDFNVVVQPIVNLTTGEVVMGEALARFPGDPNRTPEDWFNEARAVGLGVELELAAVEKALNAFKQLPHGVGLTVNIGPATLMSDQLLPMLAAAPAGWTAIELTGSIHVSDYELINERLDPIRDAGVMLTIDHTGGGHATLSRILRLRPDVIKLDRELIRRIDSDAGTLALARALVPFATELGSTLIAEGIEHYVEVEALLGIGITLGQGRLMGEPKPAHQFTTFSGWSPPAGAQFAGKPPLQSL